MGQDMRKFQFNYNYSSNLSLKQTKAYLSGSTVVTKYIIVNGKTHTSFQLPCPLNIRQHFKVEQLFLNSFFCTIFGHFSEQIGLILPIDLI